MNTDCIFFTEEWKDDPGYRVCEHNRSLYVKGAEDNSMCQHCRLWDAYIPQSASIFEKERAIEWQRMPFDEQPDYETYFKE